MLCYYKSYEISQNNDAYKCNNFKYLHFKLNNLNHSHKLKGDQLEIQTGVGVGLSGGGIYTIIFEAVCSIFFELYE